MKLLPDIIKKFIVQKIELENCILPQFYPTLDSFEEFQIGYKVHGLTGENLTGEKDGNFKGNWYVICSNYSNDPFFVDFSEEDKSFPVYFAYHGCGNWGPIKVAESLDSFLFHISNIKETEKENDKVLNYIKENLDLNNEFWKDTYEGFLYERDKVEKKEFDNTEWIKGRILITDVGTDKLKVINYLKNKLELTPQQASAMSKQVEIDFIEGYSVHLESTINYLESLGATAIFRPD
jgi:hypothetical protein